MSFADLFHHVAEWSVEELTHFLAGHRPDEFQLIDVRQPFEYRRGHLPGARLVPADQLSDSIKALDKAKPVILYCAHGVRSRAAGQVLLRGGFHSVVHLKGGLQHWEGGLATGLPDVTTRTFAGSDRAEDQAVIAWCLEENTRIFYRTMAEQYKATEVGSLFGELSAAEDQHKDTLRAIWEGLNARLAPETFPHGLVEVEVGDLMEGGLQLAEVLSWARGRSPGETVELAMALEINAYDHYLVLQRTAMDENSCRLYELLADEEKRHLQTLAKAIEDLSCFSGPAPTRDTG